MGRHVQFVKGLRDWEGEITGKPAPGSKFTQLKIGMPMKQVTDLVGQPSDQGAYITGKAFIPLLLPIGSFWNSRLRAGQKEFYAAGQSADDHAGRLGRNIYNRIRGHLSRSKACA